MQKAFNDIIERLEEELKYADEVKEKCARENQLMFDNAKGYSTGIANARYIVNEVAEKYVPDTNVGDIEEVCEWREDMTLSRSAIGHGKFESLMYICKWKYCPYCGKKIKVVE